MRARNIKPAFFQNELLTEINPFGRLLFIGLWCLADRKGRLEDRPKRIKMQLFALDDVDIIALLDDLEEAEFIQRYTVNGNDYIQIINFTKHQRPHSNESASEIPDPMDASASPEDSDEGGNEATASHHGEQGLQPRREALRPDTGYRIPDSLIPDTGLPEAREALPAAAIETAEILRDAPWVDGDIDAVAEKAARAFGLVPEFKQADGPLEAEKFVRYHAQKPPKDWYRAYLNWIKNAVRFNAESSHNGRASPRSNVVAAGMAAVDRVGELIRQQEYQP